MKIIISLNNNHQVNNYNYMTYASFSILGGCIGFFVSIILAIIFNWNVKSTGEFPWADDPNDPVLRSFFWFGVVFISTIGMAEIFGLVLYDIIFLKA